MKHVLSCDGGVTLCTHLITTEVSPSDYRHSCLRQESSFSLSRLRPVCPAADVCRAKIEHCGKPASLNCSTLRRCLPKTVALRVIMGLSNSSKLSRRCLLEGAASWAALTFAQGCGYTSNYIYHPPTGSPVPVISGPVAQASLTVTATACGRIPPRFMGLSYEKAAMTYSY